MIAADFCRNSLILAGILDPEEEITPQLSCQALDSLNLMLSSFASGPIGIPYINNLNFTTESGKSLYTAGPGEGFDILTPEILNINEANVQFGVSENLARYPLEIISYNQFNRIQSYTSNSIPAYIFLQEQSGFGNISLWPRPSGSYIVNLMVSQKYPTYTQFENIDLPAFCQLYFKYLLASQLADIFQVTLPAQFVRKLSDLENDFNLVTARDISITGSDGFPITSTNKYWYNNGNCW